ncbi:MAG: AAA family ATPase, partial [Candidatus Promineifilaceae bacterium]
EGDVHYDTISAFIKSLRGSDPDAALYWMAKMVYAGEDPRFIFRRMAILAGEDVGLADPNAAVVVASCWQIFERVGMPEGRFALAEAALYLATCPKSNSSLAFFDALTTVEREQESEVPNHLRDASRDKEGFGHGQGYLYPHAYRDHWVAQQYLPDGLQGKLFYEPSDQGYERQIGQQVARRREAQLAAMVEGEAALPEVLTTSPEDRARDAWLQRAIASSGRALEHQRQRLFEMAAVRRHHLLLDLNAGSGLLTWEGLRQAPEGGVWALTPDAGAGEALRQQGQRLPEVERPVILIGQVAELPALLALRGEEDVRFDCILGRNAFTVNEGRMEALRAAAAVLRPGGRLCLAQVLPREGQRLYELLDWSDQPTELAELVRQGEEAIYGDAADPLVNWDAAALQADLEAAGFRDIEIQADRQGDQRRVSEADLVRWFPDEDAYQPGEGRLSYAQRLAEAGLTDEQIERVQAFYQRRLAGQVVAWRRTLLYVQAVG